MSFQTNLRTSARTGGQTLAPLSRRRLLGWLTAAGLPALGMPAAQARPNPGATPLMLAREAPEGIDPSGYLVSEKLDGARAVWDGRTLRFRSGLPIAAPEWFTARLPALPLDGELWLARGRFEALSGTVRKLQPVDAEWRALRYQLFDMPGAPGPFSERAARLQALARQTGWPAMAAVAQARLADQSALQHRLAAVVNEGGEGLMLHRADALWRPGRSEGLLKLKPLHDAEALVTGHVAGRGKHEGRMGALRVRLEDGSQFLIGTGFSDAERERPPAVGTPVTYTYRGLTANGVPRFASFLRVKDPI